MEGLEKKEPVCTLRKRQRKWDWTHTERRLTSHYRTTSRDKWTEAYKRKTKTDDAGLDDDRWIWKG